MALNAKADAAAAKRVAGYERENARDVGIAVPARGAGGRGTCSFAIWLLPPRVST